jgi:hypothetical protein
VSIVSRREFAEAVALAALAPMVGGRLDGIRWPAVKAGAVGGSGIEDPGAMAKALAAAIRAQYGDRLSAADLATVTRQIEAGLERAEKVRQVPLGNGDEPDFVFSAVRPGTA